MSDFELLATAEQAAREAGALLRNWSRQLHVSQKTGPADLVTEADVAAQRLIFDLIHTRYPEHNLLGEEGLLKTDGRSDCRWIIDPLDGTSNYVHGYPYYAVSIGLERAGEMLLGVIYDPTRDETFASLAGHGATLNGQPLGVSRIDELKHAMVIASFPPGVDTESPPIARFLRVLPHAQTIHRTGSAALNLAYLAAGRIEAFWSSSLKPWDMAAGVAIVHAAGGRVTRMDGSPLDLAVPDMLASNATAVHADLQRLLTGP